MISVPLAIIFSQIFILLGIIIPIVGGYFAANFVFKIPLNQYEQANRLILGYTDLVFQDLILILNTTNSIFDAIEFLAKAHYPIISQKFKKMTFQINFFGNTPENLLSEFITNLPNGNLKERMITIIATKFQPEKLLQQLESLSGEKKYEYEAITRQLESKLVIIIGISLLFPLVLTVFLSMTGLAANFISLLMVPLFIGALHQLKTRLLEKNFALFGEKKFLEKDELGIDSPELLEFMTLLTYLGNELKRGTPQEIALLRSAQACTGVLKHTFLILIQGIFWEGKSFSQGWSDLKMAFQDSQVHFLMDLVDRMLNKSSLETGNRILSTLQHLKTNRELIRERESIIKAQQFKAKFMIFISSAVLGLLAGLSPFLMKIGFLLADPETTLNFQFIDALPLIISICVMATYSAYYLAKIVKIGKPIRYGVWSLLTFSILCYIVNALLIL